MAESVFDAVRSKMRRLQEQVAERDASLGLLHRVKGRGGGR